ncbi:MAG: replicative DNA helicase [Clostridiales bacterium]|nr:replicative DNA helicase [Clostridiales bacterium]
MPAKKDSSAVPLTMPNSVEAEQSVLCCILRDEVFQSEIIAALNDVDFYQNNHAVIFRAMKAINSQTHRSGEESKADTVNLASVIDHLRRSGELQEVGDIDYITRLNDFLPSTANYDEYLSIVIRASKMRQLIRICGEVTQKAHSVNDAEEAITYAEEEIFKLSQGGTGGGLISLSDETSKALWQINERFLNPGKFRGVQTGFRRFDRLTNGLHGGELIVLAARPGVGKSALAMNIVEHVAKQGKTVAVFSLEMSNQQLVERMLSSMSTVPLEYIKSGQLPGGANDLAKLRVAQETICSSMHLYGNDNVSIRPPELISQCRRLKTQHGLDLIVIDYIQLMSDSSASRSDGRQQEVARISRSLKLLAKELDVPVIALSQLKRDAEIRNIRGKDGSSGSSEPVLSDLRESGAIEQDADIVAFIHKETDGQGGNPKYSLIIAKHRNGEQATLPIYWIGKIVRFVDDEYLMQHGIRTTSGTQTEEQVAPQEDEQDFVTPEYVEDENKQEVIEGVKDGKDD